MATTFTIQALADEINLDPTLVGYKEIGGEWKSDQVIADLINEKTKKIDRVMVSASDILEKTTYDAYNNLSIDEQEYFGHMLTVAIDPNGGGLRVTADAKLQLTGRLLTIAGIAGTGNDNASWWAAADRGIQAPAFLSLLEIDGSRAEVLWGEGRVVSSGQVGAAANL